MKKHATRPLFLDNLHLNSSSNISTWNYRRSFEKYIENTFRDVRSVFKNLRFGEHGIVVESFAEMFKMYAPQTKILED